MWTRKSVAHFANTEKAFECIVFDVNTNTDYAFKVNVCLWNTTSNETAMITTHGEPCRTGRPMKTKRFTLALLAVSIVAACETQDFNSSAALGDDEVSTIGAEGAVMTEATENPAAVKPLPWGDPGQDASDKNSAGTADAPRSAESKADSSEKWTSVFPDPWAWCQVKVSPADGSFAQMDTCWNPPSQWCASGGYSGAITDACSPDGQTCCKFGSACIPCGWNKCNDGYGNCPKALDNKSVCEEYLPRTICLDEYFVRAR